MTNNINRESEETLKLSTDPLSISSQNRIDDASAYVGWKKWEASNFGKVSQNECKYFSRELNKVTDINKVSRILEVGFGNGNFIGWVGKFVPECHGVETSGILRSRAIDWLESIYSSIYDSDLNEKAESFDLIVAFDVLEHVGKEELPAFLAQICKLLKPGGNFIARFPNGDSPFGRMYQHGDITHVTTIGKSMLVQIAQGTDLVLIEVRSPSFPLGMKGAMTYPKRLLIKTIRKFLERLISFVYFDGRVIVLDANLVAIWKKKI